MFKFAPLLPPLIFVIYFLGIYAIVVRQDIQYIYQDLHKTPTAAVLLALFFLTWMLSLSAYLRAFITVRTNPGAVPLDPKESHESFYKLQAYACEPDGRPKWCQDCQQRKPDRAHHSRKLGRCIRKMDHECPWVGGVVSETSFNFFLLFTIYTFAVCAVSFATSIYTLHHQLPRKDGWVITSIIVSGIFGGFAGSMSLTVARFVFTNYTLIEFRRRKDTACIAVRIASDTPSADYPTITFPVGQQGSVIKFAILTTGPKQNPWNRGYCNNWKSVMGNSPLQWLLPIWNSPCCNSSSEEADYPFGHVLDQLKAKHIKS